MHSDINLTSKKYLQKTRILWLCGHSISHYVLDPSALSPQLSPRPSPLIMSSLVMSCRVVSCLIPSCRVSSLRFVSHVLSRRVVSFRGVSRVVSLHFVFGRVVSSFPRRVLSRFVLILSPPYFFFKCYTHFSFKCHGSGLSARK